MRGSPSKAIFFKSLRHAPVVVLSLIYLCAAGRFAAYRPLWFDEIFTYTIASFDGPVAITQALLNKVDNNPPLDYLVRHFSLALFGNSELALRAPSVVAVLGSAISIYVFVLRRCSVVPAIFAFSFLLSTMLFRYAHEGRGYALLLASMCVSLLAWQLAAEKPTNGRLVLLALSLSMGPFSHYYGVLNYVPIIIGEAWRCWEEKRICWPIVISVSLSAATLGLLIPFALNASEGSGYFWTIYGPDEPFRNYLSLFGRAVPPLIASLVACSLLVVFCPGKESKPQPKPDLRRHELVAAVVVTLTPFMAYFLAELLTGALTARYVLITLIGPPLLAAFVVQWVQSKRRIAATVITSCFGLWSAALLLQHTIAASDHSPPVPSALLAIIDRAEKPVVMADAHEFLVAQFYLSEVRRQKIAYVLDLEAARHYLGFDNDERSFLNLRRFVPMNVLNRCDFMKKHRQFLVIAGKINWLVPKLVNDKAAVTLHSFVANKVPIYDVDLGDHRHCE
jgi:uncharacterized membrane protein